jgi:hypothetical protein
MWWAAAAKAKEGVQKTFLSRKQQKEANEVKLKDVPSILKERIANMKSKSLLSKYIGQDQDELKSKKGESRAINTLKRNANNAADITATISGIQRNSENAAANRQVVAEKNRVRYEDNLDALQREDQYIQMSNRVAKKAEQDALRGAAIQNQKGASDDFSNAAMNVGGAINKKDQEETDIGMNKVAPTDSTPVATSSYKESDVQDTQQQWADSMVKNNQISEAEFKQLPPQLQQYLQGKGVQITYGN